MKIQKIIIKFTKSMFIYKFEMKSIIKYTFTEIKNYRYNDKVQFF